MYSSVTGSSTLSLWLWHSTWARLIKIRASAVKPAKAITTWLSNKQIFRTVRSSCNLATDFFSTPSTTTLAPRTPTWNLQENQFSTKIRIQKYLWFVSWQALLHDKHLILRLRSSGYNYSVYKTYCCWSFTNGLLGIFHL